MKLKEVLIYICTILFNILVSFLLSLLFFKDRMTYLTFAACGEILLSTLIISLIAKRLDYKLDIFAYDIKDNKYLILNSIFIGNLFSIPIAMFVALLV